MFRDRSDETAVASHRCDQYAVASDVEYHVTEALRCVARIADLITKPTVGRQAEIVTNLFRIADHLKVGVLEAVTRPTTVDPTRPTTP